MSKQTNHGNWSEFTEVARKIIDARRVHIVVECGTYEYRGQHSGSTKAAALADAKSTAYRYLLKKACAEVGLTNIIAESAPTELVRVALEAFVGKRVYFHKKFV